MTVPKTVVLPITPWGIATLIVDQTRLLPKTGCRGRGSKLGRMARTRMTAPQRRDQLVGVGRQAFAERGFDGVSMEEIAARAGVSKPVVYEHFGSKAVSYTHLTLPTILRV